MRKKEQMAIFIFGIAFGAILLIGGYFIYVKIYIPRFAPVKSQNRIHQAENLPKQKVVVVKEKIEKGGSITEDKLTLADRPADTLPATSATDLGQVAGKKALVDLDPHVIVTQTMVLSPNDFYKPDERLDDYELTGGLVAGTAKEGDFIDVEYIKTNGVRYTVLSKKVIKKKLENKCIFQVNTGERQKIEYALAEQAIRGGKIKSVLYLDPSQQASPVTYPDPEGLEGAAAKTGEQIQQSAVVRSQVQPVQPAAQVPVQAPQPPQPPQPPKPAGDSTGQGGGTR